jgi:parvulin-like peptidyl-prolyl isomerase
MPKVTEVLEGHSIKNNEELKAYLDQARRIHADLYLELHMAAGVIESNLSRVKGVTNRVRARVIGRAMRTIADLNKTAVAGLAKVWTTFETYFAAELSQAASAKRKQRDTFTFK